MASMNPPVLIASAWPYANGSLHLGHAATLIGADVLARYFRLKGHPVLFVSGSDCYGTPIVLEAMKRGVEPSSVAEHYHKEFSKTLLEDLSFSFDLYTKTTAPEHAATVQAVFLQLHKKGAVYPKTAKALFSPFLNRFLPDRFVEGVCPDCGFIDARGDQCDECGSLLDPLTLKEPRVHASVFNSSVSDADRVLETRDSEHFYLNLQECESDLIEFVTKSSGAWRDNAARFTQGFLKQGLKDRAITRDTDWGVPVPLPGYEDKRMYVWFDAVLGYLSASQHYSTLHGDASLWERWWKNDDALHYYVHGKDNVPFHTLILPAILSRSNDFHLPDIVISSEYLSLEGKQFSTSRNHAVWVPDFLDHFDSELLRYFMLAHGPETGDVDFRWSEFAALVNGELVGTFGNLVHRICSFAQRQYDGKVLPRNSFDEGSQELFSVASDAFPVVGDAIAKGQFRRAFREVFRVAEKGNQFAHIREPWKHIADAPEQAETDIFTLLHLIYTLSLLFHPFLPKTSHTLQEFFGTPLISGGFSTSEGSQWVAPKLPAQYTLSGIRPLFSKIEDSEVAEWRAKLK